MAPAVEMNPSTTTGFCLRRGRQNDSGNAADLETAHLGQHIKPVAAVGPIHRQGRLDDRDLVGQLPVVDAGAPAGHIGHPFAAQHSHDGRRGRGVGNAHVARAEDIDLVGQRLDDLDAGLHRLDCLRRVMAGPLAMLAAP